MANDDNKKPGSDAATGQVTDQTRRVLDLPHLIKWILLILLLLLLGAEYYAGEYDGMKGGFQDWSSLVLLLKILLIIGLLGLMKIQRCIKCEILTPTGCTEEVSDISLGTRNIEVTGSAYGGAFSYYTLDLQKDGDTPYLNITSYPGGTSTGIAPVNSGFLGSFNTTLLLDGAYTITLRVYPIGGGAPCVKTRTFILLKVAVWISNVSGVTPTTNFLDEAAELGSGSNVNSFGGPLNINGCAYIYECSGRKIKTVEMRYAPVASPGSEPPQPPTDVAIPATWPVGNQLHAPLVYTELPPPSKYSPCTRIGINPNRLINDWDICKIGMTEYSTFKKRSWQSRNATDGGALMGGGKYSLLLVSEDTVGHRYFDVQRIWLDNWPVLAKFVKFQIPGETSGSWVDIPSCTDILVSWGQLRIVGLAWDALIDPAFPAGTVPNDNFDSYSLEYSKQFVPGWNSITVPHPDQRVPNTLSPVPGPLPADADAAVLADWDLSSLDAGNAPSMGDCSNPAGNSHGLYRNCECTYQLKLRVSDTTTTQTVHEYNVHHPIVYESIKVVNDL